MKNYVLFAVAVMLGSNAFAQTLAEALKKTDNERFELAQKDYEALIAQNPGKGDIYLYLGENFRKQGDMDAAIAAWKKAFATEPTSPLSIVANGNSLWYAGDSAAGKVQFMTACKMTKSKNAEVMRQIGTTYTYAPIKNIDAAIAVLNDAIKLDPKNTEGYLILGDALMEKTPTNGTPAIAQYNKVLDIDPKNCKGIVRKAKLYQRSRAYEEANALYKEAQSIDPTFAPAYRENAELNMLFDQNARAIENWKKYIELNDSYEARYRFATALYSAKRYCDAITEINQLHADGFVNFYTRRMLSYSLYECNPDEKAAVNTEGLAESDRFFSIVPKDKIISLDHKYRGLHYVALGNDSLAILEYGKAMDIDTSKRGELSGDVAKMYLKAKKYDLAIAAYNVKLANNPENLNATEFFELGRAYYFGPKNYALADSCFKQVTLKAETSAIAYAWRARCQLKFDATNANYLAQPHYEAFMKYITEEEKTADYMKNYQIEACKYLGDFYVNSKTDKDLTKAKEYWKIVQTLNPEDAQAKAFFASPAGK